MPLEEKKQKMDEEPANEEGPNAAPGQRLCSWSAWSRHTIRFAGNVRYSGPLLTSCPFGCNDDDTTIKEYVFCAEHFKLDYCTER